jgi:DNA polymerase-3 subunit alpha
MAALLSCEMIDIDKTAEYTEECRAMRIEIMPPDVNRSGPRFGVEGGRIRYALAAIKGVGEAAVAAVLAARRSKEGFPTLFDLCERVDLQKVNRGVLEALIHAGAMDSLEGNRAQKIAVLEDALAMGSAADRDRRSGQASLFGMEELEEVAGQKAQALLPDLPDLPEQERLQKEKEVLGFYLTGHPLNRHRSEIHRFATATVAGLKTLQEGATVVLGGIIAALRPVVIRSGRNAGQKMAVLRFEDFTGSCEAVIFSDLYLQLVDRLAADKICFLKGEVDHRREEPSLRVSALFDLSEARIRLTRKMTLEVDSGDGLDLVVPALHRVLRSHPGPMPVFLSIKTQELGAVLVQAGDDFRVDGSAALLSELEKLLGAERVRLN